MKFKGWEFGLLLVVLLSTIVLATNAAAMWFDLFWWLRR